MSKVINLGRITGKTPELKVDNRILKTKYEDENDWKDLFEFPDDSGSGVLVVDKFSDLPAQAQKGDVAFVKTEELRETVNRIDKAKINVQGLEVTRFDIEPDCNFITDEMLGEISPELVGKSVMFGAYLSGPSCEIDIQCIHYTPEMCSQQMGINHVVDCHYIMQYNNDDTMTQWFKLKGISVKDYITMMMEFPGTEEQIKTLLGEHYEDKTEDNPSYNWIKVVQSESPVNNSSVDLGGMYFTVIYDDEPNYGFIAIPYGFVGAAVNSDGESLFNIEFSFEDLEEYEPSEIEMYLNYANTFLNLMFFGGMEEIKYDIFHKKGFYRFDEEWNSLEDEMNIPKVAKTFADLPKSFVENGLMVVATDDVVMPEPSTTMESMSSVTIQVNPNPSIDEEISALRSYLVDVIGAPSDVANSECIVCLESCLVDTKTGHEVYIALGPVSENGIDGVMFYSTETNENDDDITTIYCYFNKPGASIDTPGQDETLSEGCCWYKYQIRDNGKSTYLHSYPTKVTFDDWFVNLSDLIVGTTAVCYSLDDDEGYYEPSSYEFNNIVRFFDESKKIVHNRGFYKFSEDKWHHQPEIAGAVFENADILKCITEEDLGNFHSHDNQWILDQFNNSQQVHSHTNSAILAQIGYDHVHTHPYKYYLDLIDSADKVHTHPNKATVDKIGVSDEQLTYNGKPVGAATKIVVKEGVSSVSMSPDTFVKIKPQESAEFRAYTDLYEGADMKEYRFSIDTSGLTQDIKFSLWCFYKTETGTSTKAPVWLGETLEFLHPNKYYEISVVDYKAIFLSTDLEV